MELWDEDGPVLEVLNLAGLIGFPIGPLLVQPFLSDDDNNDDNDESNHNATVWYAGGNSTLPMLPTTENYELEYETNVKYAFWIVAAFCFLVSMFCLAVFVTSRSSIWRQSLDGKHTEGEDNSHKFVLTIGVLVFIFNIFNAGIEIGHAGLLVTFAVEYLNWSKSTSAWLQIVLQCSTCIVTVVCIPLSKYIRPNILITLDLVVLNVALVTEVLFVDYHNAVMWTCTAAVGLGYGIIVPSTLAWLETVIDINGKFSSIFWSGYFTGYMALPALSGFMFNEVDPLCFLYINLGCSVMLAVVFVLLSVVVFRHSCKKEGGDSCKSTLDTYL